MADAIKANEGGGSAFSSLYNPPRNYKDAYDRGWEAHKN